MWFFYYWLCCLISLVGCEYYINKKEYGHAVFFAGIFFMLLTGYNRYSITM